MRLNTFPFSLIIFGLLQNVIFWKCGARISVHYLSFNSDFTHITLITTNCSKKHWCSSVGLWQEVIGYEEMSREQTKWSTPVLAVYISLISVQFNQPSYEYRAVLLEYSQGMYITGYDCLFFSILSFWIFMFSTCYRSQWMSHRKATECGFNKKRSFKRKYLVVVVLMVDETMFFMREDVYSK